MKRYEVLTKLLKNRPHKVGCEVGVNTGETTSYMLKHLPGIEKYYVVDPWRSYKVKGVGMYNGPAKSAKNIERGWERIIISFMKNTVKQSEKIILLRTFSTKAVQHVPDESLDWVFIDAHHRAKYIRENLHIWTPKVKIGGIISGHDYGNPNEAKKGWGIKQEVDIFVPKKDLNIEDDYTYWFVRKK